MYVFAAATCGGSHRPDLAHRDSSNLATGPHRLQWIPDSAPIKKRMSYASSVDGVKSGMQGISKEVQGSDFDDVTYDEICKIFAAI